MARTIREAALRRALSYVGVKESPPGSNSGYMVDRWLASTHLPPGNPWCMAFVHAQYKRFGVDLGGGASVGNFQQWATEHGKLVRRPFRGDICCYDWEGDGWPDHVGIVVKVLALRWKAKRFVGWCRVVEGNTAVGNDSNGGQVMVRTRWIKTSRFVRVPGNVA